MSHFKMLSQQNFALTDNEIQQSKAAWAIIGEWHIQIRTVKIMPNTDRNMNQAPTCTLDQSKPFLTLPGNPTVPWLRWKRSFDLYMTASGYCDFTEASQKANLLHSLRQEGQRLLFATISDETYTAISKENMEKELKELFGKINVAGERSMFRARHQKHSLKDAIRIAKEIESGARIAQEMKNRSGSTSTNSPQVNLTHTRPSRSISRGRRGRRSGVLYKGSHNSTRNQTKPRCFRCSSEKHLANDPSCAARNVQCRSCHNIGNYSKICKSSARVNIGNYSKICKSSARVNFVENENSHNGDTICNTENNECNNCVDSVESNQSEHVTILMVDDDVKSDYIHTTVMINVVTLDMILDTGWKVTLIDFDT